jgi:hypothetical protein
VEEGGEWKGPGWVEEGGGWKREVGEREVEGGWRVV